ncbi:MAG: glycosyltransferase [Okeania sp. SIO2H7]|nr:glycosyltransferase [Okeania sp. SIO2H7]
MTSISIIIPVLNEVSTITQTISTAQTAKDKDIEIIVVDGGSNDGTIELIKCLNIQIISSLPGRATQMNCGAKIATGKILLFLHGDTLLPSNFDRMLEEILVKPKIIAGAFELSIRGKTKGLRIVERMVNWLQKVQELQF